MSKNKLFLKEALKIERKEKPYAIATVISVKGSSSGRVGDKALFDEKGYRLMGYVGGGCIENRASDTAIETLTNGIPKIIEIDLDSDSIGMGIPCGGIMSILVEPQMIDSVILIRGDGSIVESLSKIAKLLNFKIIIHTSKSHIHTNKSNEELFPNVDKLITEELEVDKIALSAIKKGIKYVGVIASQKKANLIKKYLLDNGLSDSELKNLYTPIGLDLNATTPEEIALSILSEIVMLENGATGKQMKSLKK